jgi:GT2 family glycosyltransferase/glycosyltransferase involved in cell wall biosynthesis
MQPVDVIIPVYDGLSDLQLCLQSLLAAPQRLPHEIVIINDASSDPQIKPYLRSLVTVRQLTVLDNPSNLGFVATVNRGMRLHPERDVVLLNSDTQLHGNWLDRLHRCACSTPDIGTVTPFSNNATICSFPEFCRDNPLPPRCDLATLDNLFARCNENVSIPIPTAVGFCMYIRRLCLNQVGLFDEDRFGRGYGEENDFCMRATSAGWLHLLCADTFVYHKGGVSFGTEKASREHAALATLHSLHTEYANLVAQHIQEDPAQRFRARVAIELARNGAGTTVLHVTHGMGGGTEKHIEDLAEALDGEAKFLVLRPGADGGLVLSLDLDKASMALHFSLPQEAEQLLDTCRYLGVGRVHFHHTMGLDPWLWRIGQRLGIATDLTLHDYYLINANPTLIDGQARFCEDRVTRDQRCAGAYPIPGGVSADRWRENQMVLLGITERVYAPSEYTAELYRSYFPALKPMVVKHPDWERDAPYPAPARLMADDQTTMRVLVLGALSREKGADMLEPTATLCAQKGLRIQFTLLGYAYRQLAASVVQRGAYQDRDLDQLIAQEAPHLIWFPAQWPETYSYTLSAALRSGCPIVATNLGAFSERLSGRPLTWVRPWHWEPTQWMELFMQLRKEWRTQPFDRPEVWPQPLPAGEPYTYRCDYLQAGEDLQPPAIDTAVLDALTTRLASASQAGRVLTRRERVLRQLIRLRQGRAVAAGLRLIPFAMQRRFKRWLSSRPIHDIISD